MAVSRSISPWASKLHVAARARASWAEKIIHDYSVREGQHKRGEGWPWLVYRADT